MTEATATAAPHEGLPVEAQALPAQATEATTSATVHAEEAHEETWGLNAEGWVAVAFVIFVGLLLYLKVPKLLAGALDGQAARISNDLAEAKRLRTEAEALLADYKARAEQAGRDAESIVANAHAEAKNIIDDAAKQVEGVIARRTAMAETKIAAAERAAEADLRSRAVDLASQAARRLIAAETDVKSHAALTADAIADLGRGLS